MADTEMDLWILVNIQFKSQHSYFPVKGIEDWTIRSFLIG